MAQDHPTGERGARRVHIDLGAFGAARLLRVLLALAVVPVVLLDRSDSVSWPFVVVLSAISVAGAGLSLSRFNHHPRAAIPQVALDVALALSVSTFVDVRAMPLVWLALLVPAMTAGEHFGLSASVATWTTISFAFAGISLAFSPNHYSTGDVLQLVLQQVFASVAIVGAVAYVMRRNWAAFRQVARDQQDATQRLRHLISIGESATRLAESDEPEAVVRETIDASLHHGFDRAEVWRRTDGGWQLAGSGGGISTREEVSLHLLRLDLSPRRARRLDVDDMQPELARALYASGYTSAVALPVFGGDEEQLRVIGFSVTPEDGHQQVDSLELIAGHVSTAWKKSQRLQELNTWAQQLAHQAGHDQLTGLANRTALLEHLAAAGSQPTLMLFFDLNGFKAVNDLHGHEAGDLLLQHIAGHLQRVGSRPGHLVARFGGDEFVVVAPHPTVDVADLCNDLIEAIERPISFGDHQLSVGTSIGVSLPRPADTIEDQLRRADAAMYVAKAQKDTGSAWSIAPHDDVAPPDGRTSTDVAASIVAGADR